jgi:triosephosphate isomerase
MARTPLIIGNWKMNNGPKDTAVFFQKLPGLPSSVDVGIAPPAVSLPEAATQMARKHPQLLLFAQNVGPAEKGAFTGEISVNQLREVGCTGAIVGHSERRHVFHETDEVIGARVAFSVSQQFKTVLCVGEQLSERKGGKTRGVVENQLRSGLAKLSPDAFGYVAIAYEPVWAIGTGETATPDQAEEVHQWIREFIWNQFTKDVAARTRILYGGSVKPDNARSIASKPNVDGFLVGGASLNPADFVGIIQASLGS